MAARRRSGAGRPPKFESPAEMQKKVDAYFKSCEGEIAEDPETGRPMVDKRGNVVYIGRRPPTVTGLALALGFLTRKSLLDYEVKNDRYMVILKRAKTRIEMYAEERLYDRDGCMGARFNLAHNFDRWDEGPRGVGADIEDLTPLAALIGDE